MLLRNAMEYCKQYRGESCKHCKGCSDFQLRFKENRQPSGKNTFTPDDSRY